MILGALAAAPAVASEPGLDAAIWSEVGAVPRTITMGSYTIEIQERVIEDADMERWIPAVVPTPEAEAAAWLYRSLNGAKVRYERFLGAERIAFERSLSFRLGTEQLVPEEADAVLAQLYDRNHDGRLNRRELRRGSAAMRQLFSARVRHLVQPGTGFQAVPGLDGATVFADAWLDHQAELVEADPWDCPDCAGIPHLDKLAALVSYLQEYAPPLEGSHATLFAPGYNQIFLTVDLHPDRSSTLLLEAADGRSYWDTGSLPHGDGALDGRLDLVTSEEEFPGASYNEVSERWERYTVGPGNQWMYEVLVDLAHAHLPRQLQVTEPAELAPEFEIPSWFTDTLDAERPGLAETQGFDLDTEPGGPWITNQFE